MRRIAGLAGVAVLLVTALVVAATGAASGSGGHDHHGKGKTIRVVERATTDTSVDLGETGDSIGDLLAFGNELFDHRNQRKVGTDQGSCVRTVVARPTSARGPTAWRRARSPCRDRSWTRATA